MNWFKGPLGDSSKEQRGSRTFLDTVRLKSWRCSSGLSLFAKSQERGRRPVWLNRASFVTQQLQKKKKKKVYQLWKKWQETQEDYKGILRFCRQEIQSANAQIDFTLATKLKDNKKWYYKNINN